MDETSLDISFSCIEFKDQWTSKPPLVVNSDPDSIVSVNHDLNCIQDSWPLQKEKNWENV